MQETKKITTGLDVKLNKPDSLYHCIRIFINLRQGDNEPNDTFKLRWDNVYETMELAGKENILRSDKLVKVAGDQDSYKEKQVQVDEMKEMFFLSSSDQNRYILMLQKLRDGDNVGRDEYPVTTKLALDLLINTEGEIRGN